MFNFMKFRYLYFVISLIFLIPGIISLVMWRLKPSIDFTGGSLLEVKVERAEISPEFTSENMRKLFPPEYEITSIQMSGADQAIIRAKPITNTQKNIVLESLKKSYPQVSELRFETVGPVLGKELLIKTVTAGILAMLFIIGYIWYRFHDVKYGIAAVLAMLHDAFIVIGSFSLLGHFFNVEVDVLFVTALLTILSFSVHDTIVVFDRIRETVRKHPKVPYIELVNAAVVQTLGRSINNSMTIILMLMALVLLGGQTIHWFAVALLIGAITGTYSSTFTAAPLLLVWDAARDKLAKLKRRRK